MNEAILLLDDGRPGHANQSRGLLALAGRHDPRTCRLPSPRRALKRIALPLAWLFRRSPVMLRRVFRAYYGIDVPPADGVRLVVSTGGDTLVANIVLSLLHDCPNIFVGKRSRFALRGVSLLLTSGGPAIAGRVVPLEFAPVVTPPCDHPGNPAAPRAIAVMIGGDSSEYRYDDADYALLGSGLARLCEHTGARLLLTTSRRTGAAGEAALRAALPPAFILDATWYQEAPRPVVASYCCRADIIICSEDSGTMLTEALQYGKPVIAFHPRQRHTTDFYESFLARLRARGVAFTGIGALGTIDATRLPRTQPVDMRPLIDSLQRILPAAGSPAQ